MPSAILQTNHGAVHIELLHEQAPQTVANFTKLAGEGITTGSRSTASSRTS